MVSKLHQILVLVVSLFSGTTAVVINHHHLNSSGGILAGIEFPTHPSFNAVSAQEDSACTLSKSKIKSIPTPTPPQPNQQVKLHLKHRTHGQQPQEAKVSVAESSVRDLTRIQTLHTRITQNKNQNTLSRLSKVQSHKTSFPAPAPDSYTSTVSGQLTARLESGVSLGSGEYFMDVYIGTPPKRFSLILDTGSDLNWIQCLPCHDCFDQIGPHFNPSDSATYRDIGCSDRRCHLVSSPDPPIPCKTNNQTCPYYYWYGDSSNTTGDFAVETFTVNLTTPGGGSEFRRVEEVMFGCGHWNRGLFHGAAGLLGLGRGPLSFSSQLQSLYGNSFSYCLVDRNSDTSVSSKLILGEDNDLLNDKGLNFTKLVGGKDNPVDTFYYLEIKSILVGGEVLDIPPETWVLTAEGGGGTIIDSGTTLSYFSEAAYKVIKDAFVKKVEGKGYELVVDESPILDPCYNVSSSSSNNNNNIELPEFGILFTDGGVWNFPVENYFIWMQRDIVCLAILATPPNAVSIIGNYQQQNFHILYDTKNSRLGFAPTRCANV